MDHIKPEVMLVEAENSMKSGTQTGQCGFDDTTVDNFLNSMVQP